MNAKYIGIGILAILGVLVAVGMYAVKTKSEGSAMPVPGAGGVEEMTVNSETRNDGIVPVPGAYVPYDSARLVLANGGSVVLFFRAPWCPTCRALDADIRANLSAIPKTVTIFDVDYDSSIELKQKYGVTYQHTLVQVDAQGNQIAKWTLSRTLSDVLSQVQ